MQNWLLALTLVIGFIVKASSVFGAEATLPAAPSVISAAPARATEVTIKEESKTETVKIENKENKKEAVKVDVKADEIKSSAKLENSASISDDRKTISVTTGGNETHIIINPPHQPQAQMQPQVAYTKSELNDAASVLNAKAIEAKPSPKFALIPMIGGGSYVGRWGNHSSATYSLGLALEYSASKNISFEVEGGYGRYQTSYLWNSPTGGSRNYTHHFNQYLVGLNSKLYFVRGIINPYAGAGISYLYYENMDHGPYAPGSPYNQWVGNGQVVAGADIDVSETIGIGIRGSYLHPLFNRPITQDDGTNSSPTFEDAALMNTGSYRVMAAVKVLF